MRSLWFSQVCIFPYVSTYYIWLLSLANLSHVSLIIRPARRTWRVTFAPPPHSKCQAVQRQERIKSEQARKAKRPRPVALPWSGLVLWFRGQRTLALMWGRHCFKSLPCAQPHFTSIEHRFTEGPVCSSVVPSNRSCLDGASYVAVSKSECIFSSEKNDPCVITFPTQQQCSFLRHLPPTPDMGTTFQTQKWKIWGAKNCL